MKVHFYWDRHDQSNENSSCWIRVSQAWAGKNWGSVQIPRIGQEVIVSFLEGDPDRPIITGRVYNAEQTVPYELPANATQSGTKSRSSKGGTPANFNEIRMEDKKGAEQLYIHAERNQDIAVEHDESHWVGHNRTKSVDNDELARIGQDRTRAVKRNDTLMVGGAKADSVSTQYLIEAGAQIRLVCGKSVLEFNASGEINISGTAFNLYASGNGAIDTGGRLDLNSGVASEVPSKGKASRAPSTPWSRHCSRRPRPRKTVPLWERIHSRCDAPGHSVGGWEKRHPPYAPHPTHAPSVGANSFAQGQRSCPEGAQPAPGHKGKRCAFVGANSFAMRCPGHLRWWMKSAIHPMPRIQRTHHP